MMKVLFALVGCLAVLTASAAEEKMDKRYMEGKAAVPKYQKSMRIPSEETEELTREFFAKNYKAVFAGFFGKNEAGEVVQTRKFENGKMVELVGKDVPVTPATAKEVWEFFSGGETLVVRTSLMEPCGFCDGTRYVLYFDEEVKELKAFNDKYHRQHAVKEEKEDEKKSRNRNNYYSNNNNSDKEDKASRRRERKEQEYAALVEAADSFGWSEVVDEVKKLIKAKDEEAVDKMACCWAAIHDEKSARKFRHMCPVCKGKAMMKQTRMRNFEVSK